jgi:hypothetical protein
MAIGPLRLRRGTTAQHATFVGANGEVTVDTTKDTIVVHDGSTPGGQPLAREGVAGTGDVTGPGNVTDGQIAAFSGPTGRLLQAYDVGIGLAVNNAALEKQETVKQLNPGVSIDSDWSDVADGGTFRLTAQQDFTLENPTNLADGKKVTYRIKQGGIGNHVITLDTKFRLGSDIDAIVLSTVGGKVDYMVCYYDGLDDAIDVVAIVRGY